MSDREIRELLEAVIDDIDAGRVTVRRAGRLGKLVGTGLVAATLGLSGGCTETAVGTGTDAAPTADAGTQADANAEVDSGPVDLYGIWTDDAAVSDDAAADGDAAADAEVDAEIFYPPYAAPPVYDFSPA